MFKKFELFGCVFLWLGHGKVTYCHGNSLLDFCGNPEPSVT